MKLLDFIVCDDIRYEKGDKLSLMGIFGDKINLQVPKSAPRPLSLPLALYLRIFLEDKDRVPDVFKVVVSLDGKEFAKINGNIRVSDDSPKLLGLALPIKGFQVSGNTKMSLTATFYVGGQALEELSPPYDVSIQIVETELQNLQKLG